MAPPRIAIKEDSGTYSVYRLDVASGKFGVFQPVPIPSPNIYDRPSDPHNNVYFTVFGRDDLGRVDARTGAIKIKPAPTPNSSPRRGSLNDKGLFWFGDFRAGSMMADRVERLDPKTGTFTEYRLPRATNTRRSFVDDRTPQLSFSNHGASTVHVEPQD
jgi:streptogramin lyase